MRRPDPAGLTTAVLLAAGAGLLVTYARNAAPAGRFGALVVLGLAVATALACTRGRAWALGVGCFIGICGAWAATALTLQRLFTPVDTAIWLGWSFGVIVTSVRAKRIA